MNDKPNNRYGKVIEQGDTGMVIATVWNLNTGERCGLEFFYTFSQERRLQRAHAWADKYIALCEKYCIDDPRKIQ